MSKDFGLDRAKPGKVGLNADALDRLGGVLKREIADGRVPGAVAMIARGGQVGYFKAFGKRDPASSDDMQEDSIFRIFSMTKPIVSIAIMQLVEQGRILLADPLSKYIPAFADTKVGVVRDGELTLVAPVRPITIQDLLRHTSGLTYDFVGGGEHPVQKLYAQANLARPDQTNAEQVAALAKLPLMNQPGTTWDYSRSTDVLGRIVEIVTGNLGFRQADHRVASPSGRK